MKMAGVRTILGIDPGTVSMGWCLIEVPSSMRFRALEFGTINPPDREPLHKRFGILMAQLVPIIDKAKELWAECVVEQPFCNDNHMATLAIAGARAIAIGMIGAAGMRFAEYPPQKWKMITGKGNATPEQYSYVVPQLLGVRERMSFDAAAAGGLAIYHGTR